ncbi:TrmB family transcriptional regulator [Candidatus Woesearchaeota archaeon]|jgi:HTH-type transcriptional regulator, sugar sensing transcriptional regulator|nr:TrmB family transcriptional regulator [Candidatus Woesearchaeota archaeon]MBT6044510.1 TrmB family transcriptional regulator [Candidatus Woesearchaeota archaeon]
MIVKEELLKKLRASFDLNIYEVKIWTSLLCRGVATAGELSDISQIPRSRSYDVLDSLEKKGFVMMKLGKPIKYIAIEPTEIIRRIKDQVKEKSKARIEELSNIKDESLFTDLNLLYGQGVEKVDSTNLSGSVQGRDAIYSQLKGMLESAKKEVVIATTGEGAFRKMKKFKSVIAKLKDKGVSVKVAAPVESLDGISKDVRESVAFKKVEGLDARFCVVDRKQVLFMVSDDKSVHETYDSAVWVDAPYFSESFSTMFDAMWTKGSSLK